MSHISYSELKEWTTCAWKHKLNYIDKIKQFKGNEHTSFGSALHTVCEVIVQDYDENKKFLLFLREFLSLPTLLANNKKLKIAKFNTREIRS